AAGKNAHPVRAFRHVAPQLTVCYGTAQFSWAFRARRRSPRRCKVPLNFKGLAQPVRDGAEPAELPKEQVHGADQNAIIPGMAALSATALWVLARGDNVIDRVKVGRDRSDALVAAVADLARLLRSPGFSADEQTRALSGVLDRAGIDGLAANVL